MTASDRMTRPWNWELCRGEEFAARGLPMPATCQPPNSAAHHVAVLWVNEGRKVRIKSKYIHGSQVYQKSVGWLCLHI